MNLTLLAALGVIALIVLIFLGMNVGIAMFLVGIVGYFIATGNMTLSLSRLGTVPFTTAQSYSYVVIPLFVLMGEFTLESGMSQGLYNCCAKWFGHFAGGLNLATIVSNALFGAICGSSSAAVATMGKLAMPETRRYHYDDSFTAATCSAGVRSYTVSSPNAARPSQLRSPGFSVYPSSTTIFVICQPFLIRP